jgi:hypothetical protein
VHRRNCVGCHIIEGDGGDFLKLVADPSLGPPMLTPEGARVQPDWLYAFLARPITIRPWLDVRMPTFGLDDRTERRHQLLRRDLEHDRAVPDARARAPANDEAPASSCSSCSSASSATCSARFPRISRRRTSRRICAWRRAAAAGLDLSG